MGGCWMVVARMVASGYSFSSLGSQTKEVKVLWGGREGEREGGRDGCQLMVQLTRLDPGPPPRHAKKGRREGGKEAR